MGGNSSTLNVEFESVNKKVSDLVYKNITKCNQSLNVDQSFNVTIGSAGSVVVTDIKMSANQKAKVMCALTAETSATLINDIKQQISSTISSEDVKFPNVAIDSDNASTLKQKLVNDITSKIDVANIVENSQKQVVNQDFNLNVRDAKGAVVLSGVSIESIQEAVSSSTNDAVNKVVDEFKASTEATALNKSVVKGPLDTLFAAVDNIANGAFGAMKTSVLAAIAGLVLVTIIIIVFLGKTLIGALIGPSDIDDDDKITMRENYERLRDDTDDDYERKYDVDDSQSDNYSNRIDYPRAQPPPVQAVQYMQPPVQYMQPPVQYMQPPPLPPQPLPVQQPQPLPVQQPQPLPVQQQQPPPLPRRLLSRTQ